jgi:opine dehydrogenase
MLRMQVGIVGAGSIAYGTSAFLEQQGHQTLLWSPSGERTKALRSGEALVARGAIEGSFNPAVASSAQEVVESSQVLLIALPAYGHKSVLDAIAPYVKPTQTVIISSHASFGALYLSRCLPAVALLPRSSPGARRS